MFSFWKYTNICIVVFYSDSLSTVDIIHLLSYVSELAGFSGPKQLNSSENILLLLILLKWLWIQLKKFSNDLESFYGRFNSKC